MTCRLPTLGLSDSRAAAAASMLVAAIGTSQRFATPASGQEATAGVEAVEADIDLSEANYQAWRDHILPNESEMAWEQIPWLTTFKDGIVAANAAEKPLLLWTMNGHPLGCT